MDFKIQVIRPAPYEAVYDAMRTFTAQRTVDTPDEIWLCEHPRVYTLGLAGKAEHVLAPHGIPVIKTNRGGQVTYHGPGQVVAYVLMDMRRRNYFVREYVRRMEQAAIDTLACFGVDGFTVNHAPGVYVRMPGQLSQPADKAGAMGLTGAASTSADNAQGGKTPDFTGLAKISALGVKVSNHCTYHGIALNVCMDLQPFEWINPCGYQGLKTTDLYTMGVPITEQSWEQVAQRLAERLVQNL